MNDDHRFSRAGDVLKNLFDRLVPDQAQEFSRFFSGWASLAGPELAMHVFPRDVINHVVILETDHPGWSQRVRLEQERILKEMRKKYPELGIRRLKVVVGDGHKTRPAEPSPPILDPIRVEEARKNDEAPPVIPGEDDESFFELLETMRRRGDP